MTQRNKERQGREAAFPSLRSKREEIYGMGFGIRKEELDALREKYPKGCRVELVKMDDPYRDMPSGMEGVVEGVDDIGTIHIHWSNGSHLGIAYGEDECRKVGEDTDELC